MLLVSSSHPGLDENAAGGHGTAPQAPEGFDLCALRLRAQDLRALRQAGQAPALDDALDGLLLHIDELLRASGAAPSGDPGRLPAPRLHRRPSADERFLQRVAEAIDANLGDEDFDVGRLAACLAVGRSHLYRRLAAVLACSPARLILERRLEHAAHALRQRAGNVSDVAFAMGFKTVSHFSQRFRQRYGMPPSAYAGTEAQRDGRNRN